MWEGLGNGLIVEGGAGGVVQGAGGGQGLSVGVKAASAGCAGEFLSAWSTDRAIVFAQCPCPSRLRHSLPVDASHTWQALHPSAASFHGPQAKPRPRRTRAHRSLLFASFRPLLTVGARARDEGGRGWGAWTER